WACAAGGRGKLEDPSSIIARGGVEKRRGWSVAGARDSVAMHAVPAIEGVAAFLTREVGIGYALALVNRLSRGVVPLANLVVVGQINAAEGEPRTLGNADPLGRRPEKLGEHRADTVLKLGFAEEIGLGAEVLG